MNYCPCSPVTLKASSRNVTVLLLKCSQGKTNVSAKVELCKAYTLLESDSLFWQL